ncbi:MAG: hypothetical protein JXA72_14120 [Bacteroidales bacterium]|nr:hypothetical protein [Bacteroidales bacterium]
MDDLVELLIYLAIVVIGIIASARKKRKSMQHPGEMNQSPGYPRTLTPDPEKEFAPDLGPLAELFGLPKNEQPIYEYESVENGPSVEEAGMNVDNSEAAAEMAGMALDRVENASSESLDTVTPESFEEGQSDIQKMIAKYDAIRKKIDLSDEDDIAKGEIVSVEAAEAAEKALRSEARFFEPRKAIIYSEILKRKEY